MGRSIDEVRLALSRQVLKMGTGRVEVHSTLPSVLCVTKIFHNKK